MPDANIDGTSPSVTETGQGAGVLLRLAQSFAVYSGANLGIRALNFFLVLLYAHYLLPADYGTIYLAEIVASFLIIFMGLALDSALQRLYFQHDRGPSELNSFIGSIVRFSIGWLALALVAILLTGSAIQSRFPHLISVPFFPYIALSITTATATQCIQYPLAVYQSARRPTAYALLSVALAVSTAIFCIYWVILQRGGALGLLRGKLAGTALVCIVAMWTIRKPLTAAFRWKYVRESLAFSLPLMPHMLMASGLIVADRFIIEHYRNLDEVGIYSLSYTIGMVMYVITQSLSQAWLPIFFKMADDAENNRHALGRICSGMVILLTGIACIGILFSPLFTHMALNQRYRAAAHLVPLVVMGYFFHTLFSLFDLSILHVKRTASVFMISLIAFCLNLGLNFALVPRWGMQGAAWATTLAYAVEAAGAYLLAQKFFPLPYRLFEILMAILIASASLGITQIPATSRSSLIFFALGIIPALGLLLLVGKRDFQQALKVIRDARIKTAEAE